MSTLKVDNIRHNSATSDAITMASDGTCTAKITSVGGGGLSHRNVISNGAMTVSQRATSASFTSGAVFPALDRFKAVGNSSMTVNTTISQTADSPDGLGYCLKVLVNASQTPSGSENFIIRYSGEEQDIKRFGYGTSACKEATISFSVKSNKTGTYSVQFYLGNYLPNIIVTYTINSPNVWERKTITLPTYTTSFSHNADNAIGLMIDWHLSSGPDDIVGTTGWQTAAGNARAATGQVNLLDATSNYWQMTNVQFEVGDTATSYEHRSYEDELRSCQRYFYGHSGANINGSNSSTPDTVLGTGSCQAGHSVSIDINLPVPMRDVPTLYSTVTGSTRYRVNSAGANTNSGSDPVIWTAGCSHTMVIMDLAGFSGLVNNAACTVRRYQGSGVLGFSAEL